MNKLESLRDHQERARKLASYWKKEIVRIKKEAPGVWIWADVEEVIAMIERSAWRHAAIEAENILNFYGYADCPAPPLNAAEELAAVTEPIYIILTGGKTLHPVNRF